ncbi:hypothetical protein ACFWF7_29325, partial [Nocardia sp. NPDC060256]
MTEHAMGTAFGPDPAAQHRSPRADAITEPSGCPVHRELTRVSLSDNGFRADPDELYRTMRHEHGPV